MVTCTQEGQVCVYLFFFHTDNNSLLCYGNKWIVIGKRHKALNTDAVLICWNEQTEQFICFGLVLYRKHFNLHQFSFHLKI